MRACLRTARLALGHDRAAVEVIQDGTIVREPEPERSRSPAATRLRLAAVSAIIPAP